MILISWIQAFAPGTGTPVPGGFSTWEALELVRGLKELDIVGYDLVEVAPAFVRKRDHIYCGSRPDPRIYVHIAWRKKNGKLGNAD